MPGGSSLHHGDACSASCSLACIGSLVKCYNGLIPPCNSPLLLSGGTAVCPNLGFGTCAYTLTGAASVNLYATVCNSQSRFWGERRFCWTAPASGNVQASLCSESYDSVLAVYSGCSVDVNSGPGTELACSDDQCGSAARATFTAVQGNQYMIRWGGYGSGDSSRSGDLIVSAV